MSKLPKHFVYLKDVEPSILENIIYYGDQNFIGSKINGYNAPKAILTEETACKLSEVQKDIKNDDYSLVVFDAYRPYKAVQHFVNWGKNVEDKKMKDCFFPYINKSNIFDLGYVSDKSEHCYGTTVDLTIIELNKTFNKEAKGIKRTLKDGRSIIYFDDNTLDMFTSIDLMDKASSHDTTLIPDQQLKNRNYLRNKMKKYGFRELTIEWWHYTLENSTTKKEFFDFNVE